MINKLELLGKYEQFLATVINQNQDQFQDISEILSRHRNLSSSLGKLSKEEKRIENDLTTLKAQYSSYIKNTANEILLLNLEIGKLEKQIEVRLKRN
jgi:hypothetical protein